MMRGVMIPDGDLDRIRKFVKESGESVRVTWEGMIDMGLGGMQHYFHLNLPECYIPRNVTDPTVDQVVTGFCEDSALVERVFDLLYGKPRDLSSS